MCATPRSDVVASAAATLDQGETFKGDKAVDATSEAGGLKVVESESAIIMVIFDSAKKGTPCQSHQGRSKENYCLFQEDSFVVQSESLLPSLISAKRNR